MAKKADFIGKIKIYALAAGACLAAMVATAQQPDAAATAVKAKTGNTTPYQPANYATGTVVNSIAAFTPQQAGYTTEDDVRSETNAVTQVNITTQYFDGLGRPIQTVDWQANPSKKDMVSPVVYNAFGLEEYKFLPYPGGTDGNFKTNAFSAQKTFYNSTILTAEPSLTGEEFYYSHINYEPSPLNRVQESFAPGNAWAGSEKTGLSRVAAEKAVSVQYLVNTTADAVRIWTVGFAAVGDANNIPATTATYAAGTLYKTVTVDEASNTIVEYKDLEGHVILKKVQIGTIASDYSGYDGFLCTYYVYDDLGQLRFVIPPKAVEGIRPGWAITTAVANELCFRYEYDERQRMKAKRVPGADWVYMVYDARDRLVFTQDGNMRGKTPDWWGYTFYDNLNRPVQTGIMTYTGTWANLITAAASTTNAAFTTGDHGTYVSDVPENLVIDKRDFGTASYKASESIEFTEGFMSENNASFTAEITAGTATNFSTPTDVALSPLPASGYTLYPQTYTYYDDYSFDAARVYTTAYNNRLDGGGNPSATLEALPATASKQTIGFVTGTRVKAIEDAADLSKGAWMETSTFYDDKGRAVQAISDNYKGGEDVSVMRYNFTGKVVCSVVAHTNSQAGKTGNYKMIVYTGTKYDHVGRVISANKRVTYNNITYTRLLARNTYDGLGQLITKQTGQKSGSDNTAMENDSYTYNIRGWLKGTNWYNGSSYASQLSATNNKWFGFDLSYDWGMNANQFNGNIAGQRWKSAGDAKERAYGYKYDKANRLLNADFRQYDNGTSAWVADPILNFNVKMGDASTPSTAYDENGNIKQMRQWGVVGAGMKAIDNLTYNYLKTGSSDELTNKLYAVTDEGIQNTKIGDFLDNNTTGDDYEYDNSGNLTKDKNKRIDKISYNYLNLPYKITVNNDGGTLKGTITYIYDAAGNKLEKRVDEAAASSNNNTAKQTVSTYLGAFYYENNVLQFLSHEEGRARLKQTLNASGAAQTAMLFDYFLKDHLGNVRMVLTDETQTDYYPAATLEGSAATGGKPNALFTEKDYYTINTANIEGNPAGIPTYQNNNGVTNNNPNSNTTANSQKVYKLKSDGTTAATGLGITLKVMSGDVIDVFGKAYWSTGITSSSPNVQVPLSMIVSGLLGTPDGLAASKGATQAALTGASAIALPNSFTNRTAPAGSTTPLAYVNYILLDERFQYVGSGFRPVEADGYTDQFHAGELQNISVTTNGYIYVYCSNQSPVDVFFDNIQVVHKHGPLLEENHYYPFGLTMAGISSKALNFGEPGNKKKYNGIEFNEDLDLDVYDANLRNLDPQIGRWWQIDPKIDSMEAWSPYASNYDNPISFKDPLGDDPITGTIKLARFIWGLVRLSETAKSSKPITLDDVLASYAPISINKAEAAKSLDKLEKTVTIDKEIKSLEKSNKSLDKRIEEHEQKLNDYQNDPDKNDNKDLLKNATPEQRKSIIEKRINHLKQEIKTFKDNIQKNNNQIENLKKAKEDVYKQ